MTKWIAREEWWYQETGGWPQQLDKGYQRIDGYRDLPLVLRVFCSTLSVGRGVGAGVLNLPDHASLCWVGPDNLGKKLVTERNGEWTRIDDLEPALWLRLNKEKCRAELTDEDPTGALRGENNSPVESISVG